MTVRVIAETRPYAKLTWSGSGESKELSKEVLVLPDVTCPRCGAASVEVHPGLTSWYEHGCRGYRGTYTAQCAACKRCAGYVLYDHGYSEEALLSVVEQWAQPTAGEVYLALERDLLARRASGAITEEEDDDVVDQMGEVWWRMSTEEQAEASARAKVLAEKGLTPPDGSGKVENG